MDLNGISAYRQPVIVEEYLPGREFTTAIVGTGRKAEAVGTMEVILLDTAESHAYTYVNKEYCEDRVRYELVTGAEAEGCAKIALQAWRALGGRDAGRVDIRMDAAGRPSFMEVNPLAGLHPEHSDLPIICTMVGRHLPAADREDPRPQRASVPGSETGRAGSASPLSSLLPDASSRACPPPSRMLPAAASPGARQERRCTSR